MTSVWVSFAAGVLIGWFVGLETPLICEWLFDRKDPW